MYSLVPPAHPVMSPILAWTKLSFPFFSAKILKSGAKHNSAPPPNALEWKYFFKSVYNNGFIQQISFNIKIHFTNISNISSPNQLSYRYLYEGCGKHLKYRILSCADVILIFIIIGRHRMNSLLSKSD